MAENNIKINYNGRIFKSIVNSEKGDVDGETIFFYQQKDNVVTAVYHGGSIFIGNLIALVSENGNLEMQYQHITNKGVMKSGSCKSVPEILDDNRIRLHETWQWNLGDTGNGSSIVEEVDKTDIRF